jgi:aminopeptidase N
MAEHTLFLSSCCRKDTPYHTFALPGSKPHYTPDRPGQVQHIALSLELYPDQRRLQGVCRIRLKPIRPEIVQLQLDAVNMRIYTVKILDPSGNEYTSSFSYDGKCLSLYLTDPLALNIPVDIRVDYEVLDPVRGLYFVTSRSPEQSLQVWTQGEDEDSRFWFPCFDYPGQLATSEIDITVPQPYRVISNGRLKEVIPISPDRIRYHWIQEQIHPSYLIMLAVGQFAEILDPDPSLPIHYYGPLNREAELQRSLGQTPEMIRFFSDYFGYPYPYPKYAQICVEDFIFGGMENTSATLLTDRCLLDERAALDHPTTEHLVAHELAHQWFGDLIVIKHWSHAWIKEGMATYAETLWADHAHGRDQADYQRYQDQQDYLEEDQERYRRPMVTHIYQEAIELYDCHIYQKGSCLYHMLRQTLGEDLFKQSMHTFLQDHAHQTVETIDLLRAIDQTTGINVAPLFDQYVFRGGHPDFKVDYSWDPTLALAKVTVKQTQAKEFLFDLKIPIAFGYQNSDPQSDLILKSFLTRIQEPEQSFYFSLEKKPDFISFDHGNHTLKTVELGYALPELKAQLALAPDIIARILAAKALAKQGGLEAVHALETALHQDSFWGVRVEVCRALGGMNLEQAFQALQAAVLDPNPHVRRVAIQSLAQKKTREHFDLIHQLLATGDPSYRVEAAAATALGSIAGGSVTQDPKPSEVIPILDHILQTRAGWNEVVRCGALLGLAEMKQSSEALEILLRYTSPATPQPLRLEAIRSLGIYSADRGSDRESERVIERLKELSQDAFFFVQMAVVTALSRLSSRKAIAVLQNISTSDGRIRRRVAEAIRQVETKLGSEKAIEALRHELDQIKQSHQELLSRLESIEAEKKAKDTECK